MRFAVAQNLFPLDERMDQIEQFGELTLVEQCFVPFDSPTKVFNGETGPLERLG